MEEAEEHMAEEDEGLREEAALAEQVLRNRLNLGLIRDNGSSNLEVFGDVEGEIAALLEQVGSLGDEIVGMAHSDTTKTTYSYAQKRFWMWLQKQPDFASCLKPGLSGETISDLTLPLSMPLIKRYLVVCAFKDKEMTKYKSYSSVAGDIAAVTDLHKKNGVNLVPELSLFITRFKKGILRKINCLRQLGQYKMQDGKQAASLDSYKKLSV